MFPLILEVISSGFKGYAIFPLHHLPFQSRIRISLFLIPSFLYEERMAGVAIHSPSSLSADNKKTRNNFYVHWLGFGLLKCAFLTFGDTGKTANRLLSVNIFIKSCYLT